MNWLEVEAFIGGPFDLENDILFSDMISDILKSGAISQEEMANGLRVSKPTIKRWSRGRNLPSILIRQPIHSWLLDKIQGHIDCEIIVLKEILESGNTENDTLFKQNISQVVFVGFADNRSIAREFGVPLPTVDRWISGASSPHPFMRPHIYKWLLDKVNQVDRDRCQK